MPSALFGHVAVIGTGAIGASVIAGLNARRLALHVAAHDRDAETMALVKRAAGADSIHANLADAVTGAEIVVLAVPPSALNEVTTAIAPHLQTGCIVTDVTSIKRYATAQIKKNLPSNVFFVPGHPIAGSEITGPAAADPGMFEGKRVILTPTEEEVLAEPVNRVRQLWQALGAQVECMPADLHDRLYAYVSHLPQILAYACTPYVPTDAKNCEGVLRLSQSNPKLWAEICLANADFIREALEECVTFLGQMYHELSEYDENAKKEEPKNTPALLCAVAGLCLVATALLLEQRTGLPASRYSGKGFKDMTASAGKHSDSVLSAISSSPDAVAELLGKTLDRLGRIGAALTSGNAEKLIQSFAA